MADLAKDIESQVATQVAATLRKTSGFVGDAIAKSLAKQMGARYKVVDIVDGSLGTANGDITEAEQAASIAMLKDSELKAVLKNQHASWSAAIKDVIKYQKFIVAAANDAEERDKPALSDFVEKTIYTGKNNYDGSVKTYPFVEYIKL